MNSKKLGLIAAAALATMSVQANANNAAKKDAKVCVNTCSGKAADGKNTCGAVEEVKKDGKSITDDAGCKAAGGTLGVVKKK